MSDLVKTHVENALAANRADNEKIGQRIAELEGQGHRIVAGGLLGETAWDIVDWRTNEILAAGNDGADGFMAAGQELDPDDRWVHYDRILEDADLSYVTTEGLPEGLANAIEDWAISGDAEEVAGFIGWPVEKVRDHQH